jgi:hypothetical protein
MTLALRLVSPFVAMPLAAVFGAASGGVSLDPQPGSPAAAPAAPTPAPSPRAGTQPCVGRPEHRALDFWLGDWDVRRTGAPETTPPSHSRIELIEGQCVVYESYSTPAGYSGRSFNAYDAERARWEQFWVDNQGEIHHYVGQARDGNMYYEAEGIRSAGPSSPLAKVRMTFFNQGKDQVRQLGEQSTDGGQTWSVAYDLTYRRRAKAGAAR